ncbi:hypothetical protein [Amycolatopsis sp. PS_44_ISF1]|uniref:hypothetical protein n=1 Tax=Amycolatopsis sp. PS_44_ISF1 TaxID=2974917 RepID=UPI0028DE1FF3|nr:hypothetical protein [Amycolatopsis sp. PS_44_ISF1]MDT8914209.1 hypothetical protein [Amycolatopsis sp. PS_44_ISF1]
MSSLPPPRPAVPVAPVDPVDPGELARMLSAVLGALSAVLVLTGSFLPIWAYQESSGRRVQASQSVTAWTRLFDIEPDPAERAYYATTHVAHYGIPLAVACVVLLAGAAGALTRARTMGRGALVAGSAGVVAAVWVIGMEVSATLSYNRPSGLTELHYSSGTGFWVLLAGGIVALATLGAALLSGRRPRPVEPRSDRPGPPSPARENPGPPPRTHDEPVPQPFPPPARPPARLSE